MRKGFLIYEEMRKNFPIYKVAVSHTWLCNCSILNFLVLYSIEGKFDFLFYQCRGAEMGKTCLHVRGVIQTNTFSPNCICIFQYNTCFAGEESTYVERQICSRTWRKKNEIKSADFTKGMFHLHSSDSIHCKKRLSIFPSPAGGH
jgi:hypothetical protein